MSSDEKIGAPFTLASLPRPINSTSGRTQAAGVCSISRTKKRKRTEIAVGVDGEGILIYSLQTPQLVTSYALPPQTSFATAPYSVYRKTTKRSSSRYTYAVVTPPLAGEKSQLLCFTEEVQKDGSADTVKTTYSLPKSTDKIVAIDSIPIPGEDSTKSGSHDVFIVFQSGRIICLASNLQILRWDTDLAVTAQDTPWVKSQGSADVEHVTLTTAKAVIGGLLRGRQDIAAILDPSFEGKSDVLELTPVLCVVLRQANQERRLSLFQVQARSPDLVTSHLPPLKHLLTWELPQSKPLATQESSDVLYHVHPPTGVLHQLVCGRLLSYDFSGTIPKLYSDFNLPGSSIEAFLRISSDSVLATSRHSWGIFDVRYNSIQALRPVEQSMNPAKESKKRKHTEQEGMQKHNNAPTLITYFAETRLVVGLLNQDVVGIHIAESVARKKLKSNRSLLIDAVGKGISCKSSKPLQSHSTATALQPSIGGKVSEEEWQRRTHQLAKYASKGKVADFERAFASDLGIGLDEPEENAAASFVQPDNGTETALLTNGVGNSTPTPQEMEMDKRTGHRADDQLQRWRLPKILADAQRLQHRRHALYALKIIFRCTDAHSTNNRNRSPLKIEFFPPNVFQWLLLSGYVTKESIRRSILEDSPEILEMTSRIADGDIAKAIVDFDPELHVLSAVLNHSQFLPVGEVVYAIRVLVQSLDDHPKVDAMSGLLTNGTGPSEEEMDVDLAIELNAATHDLDHALSVLDNGLIMRSDTLRPALVRLHTFSAPIITSTLRSSLPRQELESLIRILHSELRNGGWTSPYNFLDSEVSALESAEDPDDQAVAIIASLLTCALDAIGAGAWLASVGDPESEESTEDIIHDLLHDTSEALNGFWEARFMRGLLSEFLRYASNLSKSQKPTNQSLQKQGKPFLADVAAGEALPMLPLGGKVDLGVAKTKPGKGGKRQERSAREIGMLISKRVPKYSQERIVI